MMRTFIIWLAMQERWVATSVAVFAPLLVGFGIAIGVKACAPEWLPTVTSVAAVISVTLITAQLMARPPK